MKKKKPDSKKSSSLRKKAELVIRQDTNELNTGPADDNKKIIHELQVHQIELEMQNEELREAQIEIEKSRHKYTDLYDFAPVGYFTFDKNGLILEANLTGADLLQTERSLLIHKPFSLFVHEKYRDVFHVHTRKAFEKKTRQAGEIMLNLMPSENAFIQKYVQMVSMVCQDSDGNFSMLRTSVSDITQRKLAEEKVARARDEWENTFDMIPDLIVVIDNEFRILKANTAMAEKLGLKREDLIGTLCYSTIHGTETPPTFCPHAKALATSRGHGEEVFEPRLNSYYIVSGTPIINAEGKVTSIVEVYHDISERKKMEEKLQSLAITDDLTGLYNRRGFFTLAEKQCKLADRVKRRMSLLYLDLNNLKSINDEQGHTTGDQALIDTANVLMKTFRESDIIARVGGDEFAVLVTEPSKTDIGDILIGHIQDNLRILNEKTGRGYELSLSMGVANYDPETACSIGALLTLADTLMYKDKKNHKTGPQLTDEKKKKRT